MAKSTRMMQSRDHRPPPIFLFKPLRWSLLSLGAGMRRRDFLGVLGGAAAAWPLVARAQQPARLPVVGILAPHLLDPAFPAFAKQLRELGYEDGRTVRLLIRSADTKSRTVRIKS